MNGTTARRTVITVFVIAIVGAIAGWVVWRSAGTSRVFFSFFGLAVANLYLAGALLVWHGVSAASWKILPQKIKQRYRDRTARFRLIVLVCLVLFVSVGWVINTRWLPARLHPVSLAGDAGFALVIAALGRFLVMPQLKSLAMFTALSAVFVVLVAGVRTTPGDAGRALTDVRQLGAHAYLDWTPAKDIDKTGVTYHDTSRTSPGLNLYNSANEAVARLIDNDGNEVHHWATGDEEHDDFDHVELCPNGDLVAIKSESVLERRLVRLDWDSHLLWSVRGDYHHDICVAGDGSIFTIVSDNDVVPFRGLPLPIINEFIEERSPDGEFRRRIPVYELLKGRIPKRAAPDIYRYLAGPSGLRVLMGIIKGENHFYRGQLDPFHVNAVEIVSSRGDLLFCARNLDFVGVVDVEGNALTYGWGPGQLEKPHQPSFLPGGTMLVFDNGPTRGFSRVVEVDTATSEIVWEYTADSREDFFSDVQGSCQRLANGNTLITESTSGRAFEVTHNGDIVWEFYNPEVDEATHLRGRIYRMTRIEKPGDYPPVASP